MYSILETFPKEPNVTYKVSVICDLGRVKRYKALLGHIVLSMSRSETAGHGGHSMGDSLMEKSVAHALYIHHFYMDSPTIME